eukprot:1744460-Rhodomonas_salina.1
MPPSTRRARSLLALPSPLMPSPPLQHPRSVFPQTKHCFSGRGERTARCADSEGRTGVGAGAGSGRERQSSRAWEGRAWAWWSPWAALKRERRPAEARGCVRRQDEEEEGQAEAEAEAASASKSLVGRGEGAARASSG